MNGSILLWIFCICGWSVIAQETVVIQGSIIDETSSKPIPGALVFMESHTHLWTVSDSTGHFKLNIPGLYTNDKVSVTFVGYTDRHITASDFLSGQDTVILKQHTLILKEVVVTDLEFNLKKLMLKAVKAIPDNYPSGLHELTGFYRKLSTRDNEYTHVAEALVTIQDRSYSQPVENARIHIDGFRQSGEFGLVDSSMLKAIDRMNTMAVNQWDASTNPFYKLYQSNFLRVSMNRSTHFNYATLREHIDDGYKVVLMNIEVKETDTIYQIAFTSGPPHGVHHPSGKSYLKISLRTLVITEFQITNAIRDQLLYQAHVRFRELNDRWYPEFIQVTQPRYINQDIEDGEYDISTYWFDRITDNSIRRIRPRDVLDRQNPQFPSSSHDAAWPEQGHPLPDVVKKSILRKNPAGSSLWQ